VILALPERCSQRCESLMVRFDSYRRAGEASARLRARRRTDLIVQVVLGGLHARLAEYARQFLGGKP